MPSTMTNIDQLRAEVSYPALSMNKHVSFACEAADQLILAAFKSQKHGSKSLQ